MGEAKKVKEPLGFVTVDIEWVAPHTGAWRGECERCGLVIQAEPHEGSTRVRHELRTHVCAPNEQARFGP